MNVICDDILRLICQNLILNNEFNLLMVNKHLRSLIQTQILTEIETKTDLTVQFDLCLRASSCLPSIKLQKCCNKTSHGRLVQYYGEKLRSNTKFVIAQWNYLDTKRCLLLSKKRVNSIIFNYRTHGVTWDLDLVDCFIKPPDTLSFIIT